MLVARPSVYVGGSTYTDEIGVYPPIVWTHNCDHFWHWCIHGTPMKISGCMKLWQPPILTLVYFSVIRAAYSGCSTRVFCCGCYCFRKFLLRIEFSLSLVEFIRVFVRQICIMSVDYLDSDIWITKRVVERIMMTMTIYAILHSNHTSYSRTKEIQMKSTTVHEARSQSKSRVTKKTKSDGKLRKNYNKRVERKWEKEDTLKLIQEVEARPLLWDVGAAELKLPKEHLWEEVAAALNANLNDCKGKWGNLRTSFNVKLAAYQEKIGSRHRRNDFSFLAILQADDVLESQ